MTPRPPAPTRRRLQARPHPAPVRPARVLSTGWPTALDSPRPTSPQVATPPSRRLALIPPAQGAGPSRACEWFSRLEGSRVTDQRPGRGGLCPGPQRWTHCSLCHRVAHGYLALGSALGHSKTPGSVPPGRALLVRRSSRPRSKGHRGGPRPSGGLRAEKRRTLGGGGHRGQPGEQRARGHGSCATGATGTPASPAACAQAKAPLGADAASLPEHGPPVPGGARLSRCPCIPASTQRPGTARTESRPGAPCSSPAALECSPGALPRLAPASRPHLPEAPARASPAPPPRRSVLEASGSA